MRVRDGLGSPGRFEKGVVPLVAPRRPRRPFLFKPQGHFHRGLLFRSIEIAATAGRRPCDKPMVSSILSFAHIRTPQTLPQNSSTTRPWAAAQMAGGKDETYDYLFKGAWVALLLWFVCVNTVMSRRPNPFQAPH